VQDNLLLIGSAFLPKILSPPPGKQCLLHVAEESFWLNIVQTPPAADTWSAEQHSRHVSVLLGVYFSNYAFNKLTSSESLCEISLDGAIKLMDAERTMFHPEESALTDLQNRCIQAVADDWVDLAMSISQMSSYCRSKAPWC
jgi:hypothetical protein